MYKNQEVRSVSDVQMIGGCLSEATAVPEEVTVEAQVNFIYSVNFYCYLGVLFFVNLDHWRNKNVLFQSRRNLQYGRQTASRVLNICFCLLFTSLVIF